MINLYWYTVVPYHHQNSNRVFLIVFHIYAHAQHLDAVVAMPVIILKQLFCSIVNTFKYSELWRYLGKNQSQNAIWDLYSTICCRLAGQKWPVWPPRMGERVPKVQRDPNTSTWSWCVCYMSLDTNCQNS